MSPQTIRKAIAHLKKETLLSKIISKSPKPTFKNGQEPFEALVRSIVYQQLSGKAASAILRRLHSLFADGKPTPEKVLKLKNNNFKKTGLSRQKTEYLKDLSKKFLDNTIDPSNFNEMTDEALRAHLIAVKGIGRWTADMFLMFTLGRQDVLPTGDLGIQKGFQKIFGLKKLPDVKKMEKLSDSWRPYRTVASWYLWKVVDGETDEDDW